MITVYEVPEETVERVRMLSEGKLKRDPACTKFPVIIIKGPPEKFHITMGWRCNTCDHFFPVRPLFRCEYCRCRGFSQTVEIW